MVATFDVSWNAWQPRTTFHKTDLEILASKVEMDAFPILPRQHMNLKCNGVMLSLHDQGRQIGTRGSCGLGLKVACDHEGVVAKDTPLVYFVVVAITSGCVEEAQQVCKHKQLGGERGYGLLHDGRRKLVYDIARSSGWYCNTSAKTNLKFAVNRRRPFLVHLSTTKPLVAGAHLFVAYGSGSTHHAEIHEQRVAKRAREPPVVNERRRKMYAQLQRARAAKRANACV